MKVKVLQPQPFLFEGGSRAVLLLHGFTGNTSDVRMLGRFLERKGYTCYAPLYEGHGSTSQSFVQSTAANWWQSVQAGYELLIDKGYEEIAVAGLSLGGVFSLKIGYTFDVKGIIPMCTPMYSRTKTALIQMVHSYIEQSTSTSLSDKEKQALRILASRPVNSLINIIEKTRKNIRKITSPIFIVQARQDEVIDISSAETINETVRSEDKTLKWYENSTHVITLGEERNELHKDVHQFLERLHWTV